MHGSLVHLLKRLFRLVLEALKPLEADRVCYRLVGGVLVQRSLKEVVPSLEMNRDGVCGKP